MFANRQLESGGNVTFERVFDSMNVNFWVVPRNLAEDEGFEPSIGFPIHAFQACALGRYANPPENGRGEGYRC